MSQDQKDPLERLLEESEKSLRFDIHHITDEIARSPIEISRWIGFHSSFIMKLKEVEGLLAIKYLKLFEYYQGKSEATKDEKPFPKKILKADVDLYINADHEYQVLALKKEKLLAMLKVCEQTLKTLNSRSFDIKNYIEYEKFKNGVM